MNRTRSLWMLAVVAGASCVWWTGLRADDEAAVAPPSSPITELLARIEKLERRVETLEGSKQASREVDSVFVPAGGWLATPPSDAKPGLGHGTLIVPQRNERPAGGVFLPRHVEFTPDPPSPNQPTRVGKPVDKFGGVGFTRWF